MPRRKFDAEEQGVPPRTLAEVVPGKAIVVRDAEGNFLSKIATTGVVEGGSFLVVWAARAEEVTQAGVSGREPDAVPWPAEDVWIPGDEPRGDLSETSPETGEDPHCE